MREENKENRSSNHTIERTNRKRKKIERERGKERYVQIIGMAGRMSDGRRDGLVSIKRRMGRCHP